MDPSEDEWSRHSGEGKWNRRLRKFREGASDSSFWTRKVPEFLKRSVTRLTTEKAAQAYYERRVQLDIPGADWDNLIILDACRIDAFEAVTGNSDVETRLSKGSATYEWAEQNFKGRTLNDTVYVTANPHIDIECADSFHAIKSVWQDEWDENLNTVPLRR